MEGWKSRRRGRLERNLNVKIVLPWPPSVNRYWRHPNKGRLAGRSLISKEGREYRKAVADYVLLQRIPKLQGRFDVEITAWPPDRRRRDAANIEKGIGDGLTHAGVWDDDSQVRRITIEMRDEVVTGGMIEVVIRDYEPVEKETPDLVL